MRNAAIRIAAVLLMLASALCFAQPGPTIANITNAAFPLLDTPPDQVFLASRSIATIWGTGLADSTVAIPPPWQTSLGGTEVHLVAGYPCGGGCETPVQLLYVSPTQINFLTPYIPEFGMETASVVFIRDGVRYDNNYQITQGPGFLTISPDCDADCSVVFEVGNDCLYSFSQDGATTCGLSWNQGTNRVPLGAITDTLGTLISSSNPVHQGQVITLWMTGLPGLIQQSSGSYVVPSPQPVGFGVSQNGTDIPATLGYNPNGGYAGAFFSPVPTFAGESPQYPGLDQVNVEFPTCASQSKSTSEQRYDAWLPYASFISGTAVRIYVPFEVRAGDPECDWSLGTATSTLVTSSVNPAASGQVVSFTANVSPGAATGSVQFADGSSLLGTETLVSGQAQFSTPGLAPGSHSITAIYGGDSQYAGSRSSALIQVVNAPPPAPSPNTTTTLSSVLQGNGAVTFTATVSPSTATGDVDFLDGNCSTGCILIASVSLGGGSASISGALPEGKHLISASYAGDGYYKSSGSAAIAWTGTSLTLTSSANPAAYGQAITFTAKISPPDASGTISFLGDGLPLVCSGGLTSLSSGITVCNSPGLLSGSFSISATYTGNAQTNYSGSVATITQTVNPQQ